MQKYDSQMPRCAATEPWQHLSSLGTFVLNSKFPQMHQDLLLHTGPLQTFKITLFRKRSKRLWGRAMREETSSGAAGDEIEPSISESETE